MSFQRLLVVSLVCCVGCASTPNGKSKPWFGSLSLPGLPAKEPAASSVNANAKKSWIPSWQKKTRMEDALWEENPAPMALLSKKKSPEEERANRLEEQLAIGNSQEQACQWEKARKLYEDVYREYPTSVKTAHRLAVVNDRLKRHTEAQRLYREALKLEPQNAQIVNDLGYSYFLHGQLEQAKTMLTRAMQLEPNNARFHNNLGMVYGHLGQTEEALREFRVAGSDADAYYNLAFVHASKENHEQAKLCFQKALLSDPAHMKSREALSSFERYERTPEELRDDGELYMQDPNTRWVAYVEGGDSNNDNAVAHAGGTNTTAARTTGQMLNGTASEKSNSRSEGVEPAGYLSNKSMQQMHYRSKRNEE
jgi:Flp pilus assembly protein TadD